MATLSELNEDVMTRILAHLAPRDLARAMCVSKEMFDHVEAAADVRAAVLRLWLFPFRGAMRLSVLHVKEKELIRNECHPLYPMRLYKKLVQRGAEPSLPVIPRRPTPRDHWFYTARPNNMTAAMNEYIGTIAEWAVSSESERDLVM